MAANRSPSLVEALNQYLRGLKVEGQRDGRQDLNRFIQWCGRDRGVDELTPAEVAEYGELAGVWGADSVKQLKPVKSFLSYLKKRKLIGVSLAPHFKAPRSNRSNRRAYFRSAEERAELTPEGYTNLKSRAEMLKEERVKVIADIQRAMADKDFKENAPLDAAKERQGMIESGIKELEAILANAVVTTRGKPTPQQRVRLGRRVTLKDVNSGKEVSYTLVDTREADPVTGKISSASPVGKALIDREVNEEVHITVPRGTLHYIIKKVDG